MHHDHIIPGMRAHSDESGTQERWLPVVGWIGYEVSDWGRVRSYRKTGGGPKGRPRSQARIPKILAGTSTRFGHRVVSLHRNEGRKHTARLVHHLVLEAFSGPCPAGKEACHFPDRYPANNRLDNLRWDTHANNMADAGRHDTRCKKIARDAIPALWARLVQGDESDPEIAADYGVSAVAIRAIRMKKTWVHVTRELPGEPPKPKPGRLRGRPRCASKPFRFRSILTEDQVVEIRKSLQDGTRKKDLAAAYGVNPATVRLIEKRQTWRHL